MERTGVIIVAGGGGSRLGGARPKQFQFLGGMPILAHTINNFATALPGAQIVVVLPAAHVDFWRNLAARFDVATHTVAEGGEERFHSVRNGLAALPEEIGLIAIQDGVRPLGSRELILRTVAAAAEHGAAIPVVEAVDSFREVEMGDTDSISAHDFTGKKGWSDDADGSSCVDAYGTVGVYDTDHPGNADTNGEGEAVAANNTNKTTIAGTSPASHIIDRKRLRIVQTPQVFRAELIREAYEAEYRPEFTDDASVAEHAGAWIWLCEGERSNLKITTPEDLVIAGALLDAQKEHDR